MIRAVFMDVDDTLLDFHECARLSALHAAKTAGITLPDHFMDTFMRLNNHYWRLIEEGRMTREELHQVRWASILRELGIDADGMQMERSFREQLRVSSVTVSGAGETLAFLSRRVPVWIASNANVDQQRGRLQRAGLLRYVRDVLASGSIGANKPSRAFFEACLAQAAPIAPQECLMIGDSMRADIAGAARVGMKTCWYHPAGAGEELPEVTPDWTVSDLREIMKINELNRLEEEKEQNVQCEK